MEQSGGPATHPCQGTEDQNKTHVAQVTRFALSMRGMSIESRASRKWGQITTAHETSVTHPLTCMNVSTKHRARND
jgi:hypothetical protein